MDQGRPKVAGMVERPGLRFLTYANYVPLLFTSNRFLTMIIMIQYLHCSAVIVILSRNKIDGFERGY